jgi:hypothetical protein
VSLGYVAGLGMTSVDEYDPVRGAWGTMVSFFCFFSGGLGLGKREF